MKSNKKNLLVLTSTFPRYKGDATPPFVFELSRRLTDSFNVFVLAPFSKGAKKVEITNKMKIYRYKYWLNSGPLLTDRGAILPNISRNKYLLFQIPFFVFFQFVNVFKICRKEKIDIIHAHWIIPQGLVAFLIKKITGIPYIITSHGGDIFGLDSSFSRKIKNIILKNAARITVVSQAIKSKILKDINKDLKIDVIPMGVDTTVFNPLKKTTFIRKKYGIDGPFLLFVGRLSEKKGVNFLIGAMPYLIKKFPHVKLLIIGNGERENELKEMTKKLKVEDHIIFAGAIPNNKLPSYYATADVFIGPSIIASSGDREGLPVTYMEAMSSGCLVAVSNLKGNKELVVNGVTGYIFEQKDSSDIFRTLNIALENKRISNKIKKQGQELITKNFDWQIISLKFKKIFFSLK